MPKKRLDQLLVDLGLAKTRSQAKLFITEGKVSVDGKVVQKPGVQTSDESQLVIQGRSDLVGRGHHKLDHARVEFGIDFEGLVVADIGASTGGFTQCLLENGARQVFCVDVGRDQLDPVLQSDERVHDLQGINVKYPFELPSKVDAMVVDLSFISQRLVIESLIEHLSPKGFIVSLFKPQFEVGSSNIDKGGIVKNKKAIELAQDEFSQLLKSFNCFVERWIDSPISGKKGNSEFLCLIKRS